ncbi:MAG TPA: hypothetical protein VMV77_19700 [Bacteroidales bacterium]|nr:hypothetical protein [Bacteroidales bacterium]
MSEPKHIKEILPEAMKSIVESFDEWKASQPSENVKKVEWPDIRKTLKETGAVTIIMGTELFYEGKPDRSQ